MAVIIKEPTTGYIVGEIIVTSTEELRKLERDFIITRSEKEKETEV